jgi:hypothetical protein
MADLGTLSWLERTGGKLAWHDRLVMMAQGVVARMAAKRRIRAGRKVRNLEVEDILPPDSAITRAATAMCQDVSPPFLFNHCLRAYFWARLLDDGRVPFDDEAVYTALMLHDMGLTEGCRHRNAGRCFTSVGAELAMELGAKHGWPERRVTLTVQAITLHLNVVVNARHGREAEMVRAGSGGDAAGLGLDVLHADQIGAVVERYPRHGLKREFVRSLKAEADRCPECRIAFLQRKLGFNGLIRNAPMFRQ